MLKKDKMGRMMVEMVDAGDRGSESVAALVYSYLMRQADEREDRKKRG